MFSPRHSITQVPVLDLVLLNVGRIIMKYSAISGLLNFTMVQIVHSVPILKSGTQFCCLWTRAVFNLSVKIIPSRFSSVNYLCLQFFHFFQSSYQPSCLCWTFLMDIPRKTSSKDKVQQFFIIFQQLLSFGNPSFHSYVYKQNGILLIFLSFFFLFLFF